MFRLMHKSKGSTMFFSRKFLIAVAAVVVSLGMSASSQAAFFTIQDYIDGTAPTGHTLTVDDKVFDFTNSTFNTVNTGGANGPTASQVFVIPEAGSPPGIEFQSALWNINGIQSIDSTFNFTVTALGGNKIADGEMNLLSFGARNGGLVAITETLRTNPGNVFLTSLLVNSNTGNASDHVFLPSYQQSITVSKDVSISGNTAGSTDGVGASFASLSTFDQRFSENPEPSSVVLLGLGVLGMVGYRWRRRGK